MVKHPTFCLYEPDNFVNIKGFVGVKVVLCMYAKYFACIQICTKCFVSVHNICVAIVHMGLYTSDIGWGREFYIVHETVRRQWFGVAWALS